MYPIEKTEKKIKNSILEILNKKDVTKEIILEKPMKSEMGDFSYPCFQLSKIFKKSPNDIANLLKSEIQENELICKIEAKNGYLNFFIDNKKITKETFKSLQDKKDKYGFHKEKNKNIIIEHTSANPNGPLHVGRARNPIIGDTIVRISQAAGYNVESQFYLDDMGKQVAILAWGIKNLTKDEVKKSKRIKPDHKTVSYYQKTVNLMQDDNKISEEIQKIVKKSEEGDEKTLDMIKDAYLPVLKGMKESLNRLNIKIDKFIPESKFVKDKSVNDVIKKLNETNYSQIDDYARFIDLKNFGIKGRNTKFFYMRKDGTTLYATRDIAYHLWKAKKADFLINILGEDHKLESKQVKIALELLGENNIPNVIFYAFVSLPEGKMSTRKARVVFLDDLIDECVKRAYQEVKKRRGEDLSEKEMKKIAEYVGIGAIRYNIIKVQPEKAIVFKWEEALNFEGNSAPFIQYAHARASSILRKNNEEIKDTNPELLKHESEILLIKKIADFPEIIKRSYNEYKPHLIANFLFEFASSFNQFYRDCPVLSEENTDLKKTRLYLVKSAKTVLKNGLDLIGIYAPYEM